MTTIEQVSDDAYTQAFYEVMVEDGVAPRLAEALAHRKFPGVKTDTTFFAGKLHKDQFDGSQQGRAMRKMAEKAGVSTSGKVYYHSLARFAGDPKAWIDSTNDIKRVCRENGLKCEGDVKVEGTDHEARPREKYELNPAVVDRYVREEVRKDPSAVNTPKKLQNMKDDIRSKMTPKWLK